LRDSWIVDSCLNKAIGAQARSAAVKALLTGT
jgi:hypothetical protein